MNAIVGQKLEQAIVDLQHQIDELRNRRLDVIAAWEEHDYPWLIEAGFLTQNDADGGAF